MDINYFVYTLHIYYMAESMSTPRLITVFQPHPLLTGVYNQEHSPAVAVEWVVLKSSLTLTLWAF